MIETIRPDFYRITLPMPFRHRHVHVYALVHSGRVAVLDTGMNYDGTYDDMDRALQDIGKMMSDIDRIFPTHFHTDHCGIAGKYSRRRELRSTSPPPTCSVFRETATTKNFSIMPESFIGGMASPRRHFSHGEG